MTDTWDALTPTQVAALLGGFDGPWWIAGGIAIDLFLGRTTRAHHDLDVAVLRDHWPSIEAALPGWDFRIGTHEVWARRQADEPWLVEFLLEDRDGPEWVFRRHAEVTRPVVELGRMTDDGIPYEQPDLVLLYKAKYHELEKNEADFAATVPQLGIGPRCWLAGALDVVHPGHAWIERLL